jgi:uncharacterized protein with NAD-binding domain and iron-sulfur cluster
MAGTKHKIVIIGGGCGGISTAFWLSSTAALRDRFDITVYTRGWRLGGKGASGRNADESDRIEEHGLHMWMGCYANAFRTLKDCYAEWQPAAGSPITTLNNAFTAQFQLTLEQMSSSWGNAEWRPWNFVFAPRPGALGDPPASFAELMSQLVQWLTDHLQDEVAPFDQIGDYQTALNTLVNAAQPGADPALAQASVSLLTPIATAVRFALEALEMLQESSFGLLGAVFQPAGLLDLERNLILADLGLTVSIGIASDLLPDPEQGFNSIDRLDFREWLSSHGALGVSVSSAVVRALYDLGFAYPNGDSSVFANGRGAAGSGLRFVLDMAFGYRGAPLWKMNAGMGDVVFTPLYQVLLARGVKFKFFHRLVGVSVSADQSRIETVTLQRQADVLAEPYDPLVTVKGLACWPSEPDWDQLVDGDRMRSDQVDFESYWDGEVSGAITLDAGSSFDALVLAVPPEMLRLVASALSVRPEWQRMLNNSASVATQAFQLWLKPTLAQLGWSLGPTVLTSYASPFDTWADMSHLIPAESWAAGNVPGSIAYLCGAMVRPSPLPANAHCSATVEANARTWLAANIQVLWPNAGRPIDPSSLLSEYYRCNVDPSELYVQTFPGSVQHRLTPGSRVFSNLYLAGDWTRTRYSSGCVEAAVESGILAAQAVQANT